MCPASPVCDPEVTATLEAARNTGDPAERHALLVQADQALTNATVFIPIANPVRWSLRTQRLTGFRTNMFARHPPFELIQARD
jgi:peptide/nickel transport system substrate-binding protein